MRKKHTIEFIEKMIGESWLTSRCVMREYKEKQGGNLSYFEIIKALRYCDKDTIQWVLSIGKYAK